MRKLLMASAVMAVAATPAFADDIKVGVILGYTGPLESLAPECPKIGRAHV